MNVLLHGCNGKMGRVMTRLIAAHEVMNVCCGVDVSPASYANDYPVYSGLDDVTGRPDVLIDFSHHSCLDNLLAYATKSKVPLVICTTGFSDAEKQQMMQASTSLPLLHSSNMSLGVNLLVSLVSQAAALLYDSFDIEVIERHHNQKLDAPSGTALMLIDSIRQSLDQRLDTVHGRHSKNQRRTKHEIGVHALRGGGIVGQHDVVFAGQGEVIEISHSALSRDVFGHGAIRAAEFVVSCRPGFYTMKHVIEAARTRS